ncbi:MAG: LysR family transcriptional regulator [Pseudomonadota bacterium]|jgi:LysR family glycine cleavage system transcriptional activator
MVYRLPPLTSLRAFEAAARHMSFKKAAEELHVTPAAVSQQIKALEDYLGVALFRRLTRALELTDDAQAMLPKLREGFECLTAAVERTCHHGPRGTLVLSAPPSFAARWLMPRLQRFTEAHPEVELRMSSSLGTIDRPEGEPGGDTVDLRERPSWEEWLKAAGVKGVDATRGPHFSDAGLALEAAMDGLGVALALKPLVSADVAAGRLAVPFPVAVPSRHAYYLVSPLAIAERPAVATTARRARPAPVRGRAAPGSGRRDRSGARPGRGRSARRSR